MSRTSKSLLLSVVAVFITTLRIGPVEASGRKVSPMKADFNGDGWEDLAIGTPYEDVSGVQDAGAVTIVYGSQNGLSTSGSQTFSQGSKGMPDQAEANDYFGSALAAGDFDGDGHADLAIGAWAEGVGTVAYAGMVIVLQGSTNGLTSAGSSRWYQGNSCWFAGQVEGQLGQHDYFGYALAAGDFNGDGRDDLAIGAYSETADAGNINDAGAVNVLYGSSVGLNCPGDQLWSQYTPGIQGSPEQYDRFGFSLVAGHLNGDAFEDLAIGVPGEDVNGQSAAGAVNVLYGTSSGLSDVGDQLWHQDAGTLADTAEAGDQFGWALAAGYFNGDAFEDLAIGVFSEDIGSVTAAGAVNVLYGSAAGLQDGSNQFWSQFVLQGLAQQPDMFGWAVAAADFNGDGLDDLVVGVVDDADNAGAVDAGSVNVLYGATSVLSSTGNQLWNQGSSGIQGSPELLDHFGWTLGVGDFNGDGAADLAVGVVDEDHYATDAGVVNVLYGSQAANGLSSAGNQLLYQGLLGGSAQTDDNFGNALSSR